MAEPLEPTDIDRLAELVGELAGQKLCVVGDAMLDRWITGAIERVSPEVPVPVVDEDAVIELPGGAANVARTAAALGARATLVAMVGADPEAARLKALCTKAGITPRLVTDPERPTSVKTRVGDGRHTVVRFDREQTDRASGDTTRALIAALQEAIPKADAVVVSDYAKGVIAPEVFAAICECAGTRPILVDPKASTPALYHGARWLSPNRKQAERWAGRKLETPDDYEDVSAKIRDATGADGVFLTLGAEGIWVAPNHGAQVRQPARARLVFDVTGAGDTCAAVLALALAVEASPHEAAELANAAAGVVVGIPQTGVIAPKDLRAALTSRPGGVILPVPVLEGALRTHRDRGERVVLTNGCFDVLHAGHIALLAGCRREGDIVVVALNSDASIRGLKGPDRPLTPERDRAVVMAALADVDYVCFFDEPTPKELVDRLRPDVLVKGADWADKGVVGRERVEADGGRVVLVDLIPDRSTTRLINAVRGADTMPAEDPA
ncbi:MAG: PfkB family carbohydrate kinase [Planctomycetota bacterium]|jgi:D-beta-D-heptose 7-phosphate kinase/D-beta-D-heptose 1-phosphate adenosyltransferase